jgi:hypothetical protein
MRGSRVVSRRFQGLMRALILTLIGGTTIACSSGADPDAEVPEEEVRVRTRLTMEELPPMPEYPNTSPGKLTVVGAGDKAINHAWEAEAGSCASVSLIELYAEDATSGSAIVLQYPDGDPLGVYPIVPADSVLIDDRAARVGVQLFDEDQAVGFQAIQGTLEVLSVGEEISGRFTATIREVQSDVLARYVGAFQDVEMAELSADYCNSLRPEVVPPGDDEAPGGADSTARMD